MRSQVATIITVEGSELTAHPHDGRKFTLAELQGFVGGNIELVHLKPGHGHAEAYVNEEGKLDNLPINDKATAKVRLYNGDFISGPLVIIKRS